MASSQANHAGTATGRAALTARASLAALVLACLPATGCNDRVAEPRPEVGSPPLSKDARAGSGKASATETVRYKLVGEVRRVDPKDKEVTIRHEAIPGFMDAMTMPFRLEEQEALDELKAGDRVEGQLEVTRQGGRTAGYRLRDLVVTQPAPAASLTLELSGGSPVLKVRPKRLEPGDPVPDFTLTGQDGKPFRLSDLRGKVAVLTFIYTRCPLPDFCPAMDRRFADLATVVNTVPGRADHIRLVSISFDPEHDTPEILGKHAKSRGASPPLWSYAVASHEELARVGPLLGLIYGPGKNEIMHNLCTAVIDPEGKLARLEVGTERNKWTSADLLKTISALIPEAKK
jgi:protein SCO1/2